MIPRLLTPALRLSMEQMPVVTLTGPRQSGKTTLARALAPGHRYLNLEAPDEREFARQDPRGFLARFREQGVILDEVQHVPELLSYIQVISDEQPRPGHFVLTGSQNFALMAQISQSLAGRTAIHTLLPLSIAELSDAGLLPATADEFMLRGGYPRLYDQPLSPHDWLNDYIQTYIERDVRQLVDVRDLRTFRLFVKLCAGRIGQIFNISALANETGVDQLTVKRWLSVLETSYILFLLPPHFQNFSKRLIKSPKLYFYDTGLAATLLGIRQPSELESHPLRGNLFENLVIADVMKQYHNARRVPEAWFWRDSSGNEVDLLLGDTPRTAVEIKSAQTLNSAFFKGLQYYQALNPGIAPALVYGGDADEQRMGVQVSGWQTMGRLVR